MNKTGQLSVYRGCTPVIDATYQAETDGSPAEAIIAALADAAGIEPVELPPLYDYVDFDALNSLFDGQQTTTGPDIILSFQIETWNVFVRADGRIRVCDATQPTEPEPVFSSTSA